MEFSMLSLWSMTGHVKFLPSKFQIISNWICTDKSNVRPFTVRL